MDSKMSDTHISQDTLEAYVIGALEGLDASSVERHVSACAECARRLQHEATLEVVFEAVVSPARPTKTARVTHVSAFAGAALAMAAAMLLWLVPRGAETSERAPTTPTDEPVPAAVEANADASTFTASLDLQVDGSRVGVRD